MINRNYLAAGVIVIAIGAALLAGKFLASDAIVAFIMRTFGRDQIMSADNQVLLSQSWYTAVAVILLLGGLLSASSIDTIRSALWQWIGHDALGVSHPGVPRPMSMLLWSSLCGMAVVILYVMHTKLGVKIHSLFKKEGLFENLTFVLYLLSAVACAIAALRLQRNPTVDHHRLVASFYLVCAVVFLVVAGEEVSWGQRVFGIKTPEPLVSLNHQHETNVHNLLSRNALNVMTRQIAAVFLLGVIAMWALAATLRLPVLHFVIPHPSLAGLALIASFSGLTLHLEIFEVLLAMFVTCYSYRVYKAAAHERTDPLRVTGTLAEVSVAQYKPRSDSPRIRLAEKRSSPQGRLTTLSGADLCNARGPSPSALLSAPSAPTINRVTAC